MVVHSGKGDKGKCDGIKMVINVWHMFDGFCFRLCIGIGGGNETGSSEGF